MRRIEADKKKSAKIRQIRLIRGLLLFIGNSPKFWLNAQQAWDLWQSERAYAGELTRIQPLAVAA
jgi:plasmid maintenance system antidote protein VapI